MKVRPIESGGLLSPGFDLIVIGGGINGAGIARDAAMRGLRVLLLEMQDLAAGTSAWSTRLIHGGLRYLEHAEIGLVRESLREREVLLRIAPHLVRPLALMIPVYRGARRGRWMIRAGMFAYGVLSADGSLGRHRNLSAAAALRRSPGLRRKGLLGAAVYFDAQAEFPERLVVENVLSAAQHGARVHTYARVERIVMQGGRAAGVEFVDVLTGERHEARGRMVINAAGPWVDRVLAGVDGRVGGDGRLIGGTKGSHIVVGPFPGAPPSAAADPPTAIYAEAGADGRPIFIIPWNGQYLIGTTDTRFEEDPATARADEVDVAYLLAEVNRLIPGANLGWKEVLFTYSGVRPLPHVPAAATGDITRRHIIHEHGSRQGSGPSGLVSIVGGKLTTYRALAEEVVTLAMRRLGRPDPGCATAAEVLPGARGFHHDRLMRELAGAGIDDLAADRLVRVYGARCTRVLGKMSMAGRFGCAAACEGVSPLLFAELAVAFEEEGACTLADAIHRRTMLGLGPDRGEGVLEEAGVCAAALMGWDEGRQRREVEASRGVALPAGASG